jgi:outer membrane protein assembly factor BamB
MMQFFKPRFFGPRLTALLFASCAALALGGCDTVGGWFGGGGTAPLQGKRISVMSNEKRIEADAKAARAPSVGAPFDNASWAQAGGGPEHSMGHPALSAQPQTAWSIDIGSGASGGQPLLGVPVIADGLLATIDADANVGLFDARSGGRRWSVSLRPEKERGDAGGGGVALDGGRVYVGTGYAEVLALNAADGSVIWRKKVSGPVRGAPTVSGGRVFALTLDNQVSALSVTDGALLWSHSGIIESAGLLGGNSVAVGSGLVIAPYSSGEVYGLRAENGRPVWQESLATVRAMGSMSALSDIRGLPVIDRGAVFAVSNAGRMMAVDERTGGRLWEREIGGTQTPWVAGDTVFVVTNDAQVAALERSSGLVRWVKQLPQYRKPEKRVDPIAWNGPVLAGGRLWLTNSEGRLVGLSPDDGAQTADLPVSGTTFLPPVVAGGMLYVLSDNAVLTAFR